jgi:lysophospholipid acyltransferase (LPLAT)-like uncharacterized protein
MGLLVGLLVRAWVATLRVTVLQDGPVADRPRVIAFLHGQQMLLLAARTQLAGRTAVLVSRSRDGDLQTGIMRCLGFRVLRGSSSRGATAGLRAVIRALRAGYDVLLAVDGPRGPRGVPKPGAELASKATSAALVPIAAAASSCWVLGRTWDRFVVPLPFSSVVVRIGEAVRPHPGAGGGSSLGRALVDLGERSRKALVHSRVSWQRRLQDRTCPRSS